MKIRIRIAKHEKNLFEGTYDVADADSFGQACADAWAKLRSTELNRATSVGAMMEMLDMNVLDVLDGASFVISKA
ncbi:MAG: hypothetical protein ACXWLK_08270 [Rhizomicrobium sp.]